MNTIIQCLQGPAWARLGEVLIHFLWQGALVALTLAFVLSALRRSAANLRYQACLLALTMLGLLPVGTWLWLQGTGSSSDVIAISSEAWRTAAPPTFNPNQGTLGGWVQPVLPWLLLGWLCGVLFFGGRLAAGWIHVHRLNRASVRPLASPWSDRVAALAEQIGLDRPVQLLESGEIQTPVVLGWLKPVILLPMGLVTGVSPAHVEALLAHELAHLYRHDYLVNFLQRILESLLFYHPAVWWVSRQIRFERELCCDDLAAQVLGDRRVLADALVTLAEREAVESGLVLAATGGSLTERVQRLVREPVATPVISGAGYLMSLLIAGCLGAAVLWMAQQISSNPAEAAQIAAPTNHPSQVAMLEQQLAGLDSKIARKEAQVDQLRLELRIPDVVAESSGGWSSELASNTRRNLDLRAELESRVSRQEQSLQRLKAIDDGHLPQAVHLAHPTPLLGVLLADRNITEQDLSQLNQSLPNDAPKIERLEKMLNRIDSKINDVVRDVMESLRSELDTDRATVIAVSKMLDQNKEDEAKMSVEYRPYHRVKRELDTLLRMREAMSLQSAVSGNGVKAGGGPGR